MAVDHPRLHSKASERPHIITTKVTMFTAIIGVHRQSPGQRNRSLSWMMLMRHNVIFHHL